MFGASQNVDYSWSRIAVHGQGTLRQSARRTARITAVTAATVFAFGRPALAAALKADPAMAMALLEAVANREAVR